MIELKNVSYSIGEKKILHSINASIQKNNITVILGPNGAGKSTLLQCITGTLCFDPGGTIQLDHQSIKDYSLKALSKKRAFLPQISPILFPFTVMEIVLMGRSPYTFSKESKEDLDIATQVLKKLDAYHLKDRIFSTLSGGEQQRVHIARVLTQIWGQKNTYIFLDEPTSSLDLKHQHQVFQLMQELCTTGHSVICVLHDLHLAMHYTQNALILLNGRLFQYGNTKKVLTPDTLSTVYDLTTECIPQFFLS